MHVLAIRRHGPFTGFRFREAACVQTVSCGTARARLRRRAIELSLQDGATTMALGSPLTLTDLGGNQYTVTEWATAPDLCKLAVSQHPELGPDADGFDLLYRPDEQCPQDLSDRRGLPSNVQPYVRKRHGQMNALRDGYSLSWLPAGWSTTRVQGDKVFENMHTGKKQAWVPSEPARKVSNLFNRTQDERSAAVRLDPTYDGGYAKRSWCAVFSGMCTPRDTYWCGLSDDREKMIRGTIPTELILMRRDLHAVVDPEARPAAAEAKVDTALTDATAIATSVADAEAEAARVTAAAAEAAAEAKVEAGIGSKRSSEFSGRSVSYTDILAARASDVSL